ncbi:hypothetical protein B4U37_03495 [Sutcliffiella horikoshii]|uniref:Restriction endonuclease n=1 Tax=Sutcliffiella horikoshii TaxID=79883 RepID=A0ABM6KFH8_9BACI|nr:hypothetical protein [Sutcliffiella horikoshii]ART75163.1 hypothetical protein B4U37_03495 [Sutcliffiella horikoshii]
MSYNRESEFKKRFNQFICSKITGENNDYYSKLSIEDFVDIKSTLSDINNIITYKTTISFMDWLRDRFSNVEENYQLYLEGVLKVKPSVNGYDIMVTGKENILAEIKCNKPINNGYKFGSAQKNGLIKDIQGLLEGKTKVKFDPIHAYKFLVMYDFGDHTLKATEHLIKNIPSIYKGKVEIFKDHTQLKKDKIYVVFIK